METKTVSDLCEENKIDIKVLAEKAGVSFVPIVNYPVDWVI